MIRQNKATRFAVTFIALFLFFYYFNILFFRATNPGPHYSDFLGHNLNYIQGLRWLLLAATATLLRLFGFGAIFNNYELMVAGHGSIQVVYTCLGLGVLSFFTAFVFSYPKPFRSKIIALIFGVVGIEFLNIVRFAILALYGNKSGGQLIDHHTIFNIIIYLVISIGLYFWIKQDGAISP